MIEQDMQNVISYWEKQKECITSHLGHIKSAGDSQFRRGAMCLLRKRLWEAELFCKRALSSFSSVDVVLRTSTSTATESILCSSEFDEDDDDSDEEYDMDLSDYEEDLQ